MSLRDQLRSDGDDRAELEAEKMTRLQKVREKLRPRQDKPGTITVRNVYAGIDVPVQKVPEGARPVRTFEAGVGLDAAMGPELSPEQLAGVQVEAMLAQQRRLRRGMDALEGRA